MLIQCRADLLIIRNSPQLSEILTSIANGENSATNNLRSYVQEKINDARSAAQFNKAFADLGDAIPEGVPESAPDDDRLRAEETGRSQENLSEPDQGVTDYELRRSRAPQRPQTEEAFFPGFEQAVKDQHAAAAKLQGEQLTERLNRRPKSIESAAGQMESKSPSFRGVPMRPHKRNLRAAGDTEGKRATGEGGEGSRTDERGHGD